MTDHIDTFWEQLKLINAYRAAHQTRACVAIVFDIKYFAEVQGASRDVIRAVLDEAFASRGWFLRDLAEPLPTEAEFRQASAARQYVMELGFNPWPSVSGWTPYDLPWPERRLIIGIVEGVAAMARWAHEIWERDHPPAPDSSPACKFCDDPDCPA